MGFLGIYLATRWDSVNSKIHELGGTCFFPKYSKLHLNSENAKNNSGNVFRF